MPLFCCGHCGQSIDADDALAGTSVGCPGCHNVIQVPACVRREPQQPYQPYQPPAFSQTPDSSYASQSSPASDPWLLRAPLLGTGAAFVLCFLKKLVEPVSSLDAAMGNVGPVMTFAGAIGYTLAAGIFALVAALVIAGIAAACRKRFSSVLARGYGIAVVAFALLMMAASFSQPRGFSGPSPSASTPPPSSQVTENTREELNKLQADIEKMQQGEAPGKDTATATQPPEPADDLGKLLLISRQYFEEVAALQKGYTDEIAKIGFLRVLDGERILKDTDSSEAYDLLARARVLTKKYGAKMREALGTLPAKIRASNISAAAREGHARSAEKGVAEALKTFDENWALEVSVADEIQTIIDLLGRRRGQWHLSNGLFVFDDAGDLASFNASMAKINAVAARQNEIKAQGQQNTGKMFDDLRTALPE